MTEYWVSQGNKWCDYCKIFIANNPATIRTHEFGQRHKENVSKKLADIRKENASKEKEKQQALKELGRIETQARRSYEKDLLAKKKLEESAENVAVEAPRVTNSNLPPERSKTSFAARAFSSTDVEWVYDESSHYYFNAATGYYYDSNSGLYYSELLGKWTTQEEAFKASRESVVDVCTEVVAKASVPKQKTSAVPKKVPRMSASTVSKGLAGPVLQPSQIKAMRGKGIASSLEVGKRKRPEKSESLSKDEADALAAREAARKRTQEREKGLLGLYQAY